MPEKHDPTPPNKPFYKQPEWYLEKFSPAIIVVIVSGITSIIADGGVVAWLLAIIAYLIAILVVAIITFFANKHFNSKHSTPECCVNAIKKNCEKIDQLHCEYSDRCESAIQQMNNKLKEQESHVHEVNTFISNAQQLGKMFTVAVGQRLRTNKQVAEIEANAKVGSEILIMTAYFFLEKFNEDMQNSIVANINRGVKYRYIIPYEKKNDFKEMVHSIFAHPALDSKIKQANKNTFLTASCAKKEFFMLTIAYYEIGNTPLANAPSAVIVKLPAEDEVEATDEKAMIYLVPEGHNKDNHDPKHGKAQRINPEHIIFKDSLNEIYRTGIDTNNPELAFTATELLREYPHGIDGVKIELDHTEKGND